MSRQELRTTAVILAGGTGARVGLGLPKQLLKVAGKTVIEHTLDALSLCPEIDDIVIVMTPTFLARLEALVRTRYPKVRVILPGGRDRNESTQLALRALGEGEGKVLFHDAVRPFVDTRIISDCVRALDTHDAVDVAVPSADTIIEVDEDEFISDIPTRSRMRRGQTPQAFLLSTIRRAYELASAGPGFVATDDCGVVRQFLPEVPIKVVAGADGNMKITYPLDMFIADKLFQLSSTALTPATADPVEMQYLAGKTVVVFGGSYGIGRRIAELAAEAKADVFSFSRSETSTDVRDSAGIAAALQEAHDRTGRIDVVINTAAVLTRGPLVDMGLPGVVDQVEVNFLGPVLIAREALPYLAKTQGQLVLFTSSSYTRGRAEYSLYSSCKAAVVNLTQALSDEWSELSVRVNCINPERTRTPMREQAFGHEPPESLLTPDEVARTVLTLLDTELTGQVVDVRRDESEFDAERNTGECAPLMGGRYSRTPL